MEKREGIYVNGWTGCMVLIVHLVFCFVLGLGLGYLLFH